MSDMFYINTDLDTIDRYDISKFIEYLTDNYDPMTSYFLNEVRKLPNQSSYVVTSSENRIDLISYEIYGDVQYWWILLVYNNLIEPENIPGGTLLLYPSLSDLEQFLFTLKTLESANQ
jgi:hypothetical protein